MKLGLAPHLALTLSLVLVGIGPASASPRRSTALQQQEDAFSDGDIDAEDVAQLPSSPFAPIVGATSGRPILGAPSGSAWVSLLGFTRRTTTNQQEVGGFVVLALPLDRFARAGTRVTSVPPPPPPPAELASTSTSTNALSLTGVSSMERVSERDRAQPFDLTLTPRLARSCVTAAWRASGLGADDARLDSIMSRARWSAILPEARLRAVRFEDARSSLDTAADTSRIRDSASANVGFEARLTWRFDRLIYADDEPSFERIRLEQRDARARIAAKVLEALFHWQRAVLDLRTLPPSQRDTRDEADVTLRVMEAMAALDVLTNGWFGAYEARRSPIPSPPSAPRAPVSGSPSNDL